jgi:hypothetical protein
MWSTLMLRSGFAISLMVFVLEHRRRIGVGLAGQSEADRYRLATIKATAIEVAMLAIVPTAPDSRPSCHLQRRQRQRTLSCFPSGKLADCHWGDPARQPK